MRCYVREFLIDRKKKHRDSFLGKKKRYLEIKLSESLRKTHRITTMSKEENERSN
jgi:hypothetical protein